MDVDPELDITLSNGRRVVTFQIVALDHDLGTWSVAEPLVPRRVILGDAEALETRRRLDARIAARLAAGWVPVDGRPSEAAGVPLAPDLTRYLQSLCEAVTGARAQRERRLGELAEQAGDVTGAIVHYRAALVAWRGSGVRRRLAQLAPDPSAPSSRGVPRGVPSGRASRTGTIQLACRIDRTLHARVRRLAARTGLTVRTWVIHALTHATMARGTRLREID